LIIVSPVNEKTGWQRTDFVLLACRGGFGEESTQPRLEHAGTPESVEIPSKR
jgi:hypothetical protein